MSDRQLPLTGIAYLNLMRSGVGHLRAIKQAADACEPVIFLAIARHGLGRWPTQGEYAELAEVSERTAQRQWAAFRRAFPDEDSPERYAKIIYAQFAPKLDHGLVLTRPAPLELQPA